MRLSTLAAAAALLLVVSAGGSDDGAAGTAAPLSVGETPTASTQTSATPPEVVTAGTATTAPPSTAQPPAVVLTLSIEATDKFGPQWPYRLDTTLENVASDEPISDSSYRYLERWSGTDWEVIGAVPWDSSVDSVDNVCADVDFCPSAAAGIKWLTRGEVGDRRVMRLFDVSPGEYRLREGALIGVDPGGSDAVSALVVVG